MSESDKNEIFLSSSPHIASPVTTPQLMRHVLIALAPLAVYGIYLYGIPALMRIAVCVAVAVGAEAAFRREIGKDVRVKDLSAAVTGLLLALVLPPLLPLWIAVLSTLFAVIVAKEFFGGLGSNPFNPALTGRAFAMVSFSGAMTAWVVPHQGVDAISTVTPLAHLKSNGQLFPLSVVAENMGFDSLPDMYLNLFIGDYGGCIGESSSALILAGFAYLLWKKVISWHIPVTMVATAVLIGMIAGVHPLFTLLSGGLLFGAVFMATDYATSPVTVKGQIMFGIGCGLITGLIRLFAGIPEGVMYSILIMNTVVPFLSRLLPKKYGYVKPIKKKEAVK